MDGSVFLAVLAAAIMHAGWNAVVKGGGDPFVSVTQVSLCSGTVSLLCLPFVDVPRQEAWMWLFLSAALHTAYRLFLIGAYRAGDLAQVYPISRGAAPLMTAVATALLISEPLSPTGFLAVLCLCAGVFLMSLRGGRLGEYAPKATGFALCTALSTCAYSLVDGLGARINGSGPSYALYMFVGNMIAMQSVALLWRGAEPYRTFPKTWPHMLGGGIMSMCAYFIVIWAMTKAPIALVAALRETSVLFGTIIGVTLLGEPVTRWRVAAALAIVAGVVLLRLA